MGARLAAVTGSLNGQVFHLDEGDLTIGRADSNVLAIDDPALSRQHCVIREREGHFEISDLDSRNCTFVNDVPVKERALEHGDRIRVARSVFVFLREDPPPAAETVHLDESEWVAGSTLSLPPLEALYLAPSQRPSALPVERVAHDLQALLKVGTLVNSSPSVETLARGLLESVFEFVPAERGAVLLAGPHPDEFASLLARGRSGEAEGPVRVSRTIVRRVLREGEAVLLNDLLQERPLVDAPSLVAERIASVLCVPLAVRDERLGVLYLDTREQAARFSEPNLQLLTVVAAVAAPALMSLLRAERLQDENRRLRSDLEVQHDMVGESPRLREVLQMIAKVGPADSTVLVLGESGTGKELAARAIHRTSPRAERPFAAINCAALTETLLESDLFGHEKGAFTGALAQKKGKLEVADGGTVFLDEVGELAPPIQAKLLRVLQQREFERVGGTRAIKVDVRVVAATNKDLRAAVRAGSFRQDLFYRLNVVSLRMPPLRERREDISLLAAYFVSKYGSRVKRRVLGLSDEARAALLAYDWPGNVRELENAIERAVVLGSGDLVRLEDLPEPVLESSSRDAPAPDDYYAAVREAKRQLIRKTLDDVDGSYTAAAKRLGMHVNYLHRLVRNLGLRPRAKPGG
jgi:Nif-specific regulatory protein